MGVPVSRRSLWAGVCHQAQGMRVPEGRESVPVSRDTHSMVGSALAVNLFGEISSPQAAFSQAGIHTAPLALNELFILTRLLVHSAPVQ